jgi:hypothetical protein
MWTLEYNGERTERHAPPSGCVTVGGIVHPANSPLWVETPDPVPEPETLAAAKARRLAEVRMRAASCIAASVPAPWDSLRDLATDAFRAWVDAFRGQVAAELARLEAAIESAADVTAVSAIVADWPEVES